MRWNNNCLGLIILVTFYNFFLIIYVGSLVFFQKPFSPTYSRLQHYNVDPTAVSVSGFSNGAGFSVQLCFIYSSLISACGCFSGAPYPSAYMVYKSKVLSLFSIQDYYPIINKLSRQGSIDPISNLKRTKVFVFRGAKDILVNPFFNFDVVREFKHYGSDVKAELDRVGVGHCMPTDNFPSGGDYVPQVGSAGGVCNGGYQAVNHMFHHFYKERFIWPISNNATPTGQLFRFDQNEFFKNHHAESNGLSNSGYIYVPTACGAPYMYKCKLHLAFHAYAVLFWVRLLGDGHNEFVQNTGYLQAADANNIIILFPETKILSFYYWDIWGVDKNTFFKNGTQPLAVAKMISRIVYDS